jgi:hypothetical protein
VLYRIFEQTGDKGSLEQAVQEYQGARAAWAQIVARTKGVYANDVTVGELACLRGNWADRLAAIDDDLADMTKKLEGAKAVDSARAAVLEALGRPKRGWATVQHKAAAHFRPGQALEVEFRVDGAVKLSGARLYYRHVNQAERWQSAEMEGSGRHRGAVPGTYTDSPYPLQYYYELRESAAKAWLYPGFAADLSNQPYFVVRRG